MTRQLTKPKERLKERFRKRKKGSGRKLYQVCIISDGKNLGEECIISMSVKTLDYKYVL